MVPSPSGVLANLTLLVAVPAAVALAYLGYLRGLYSYAVLPFVVGGGLLVVFVALFLVLPRLRATEQREAEREASRRR